MSKHALRGSLKRANQGAVWVEDVRPKSFQCFYFRSPGADGLSVETLHTFHQQFVRLHSSKGRRETDIDIDCAKVGHARKSMSAADLSDRELWRQRKAFRDGRRQLCLLECCNQSNSSGYGIYAV